MKIFHCNIWGDIEISDLALSVIDTIEFQRLHYIRQTGCAYKVFPTAVTCRFEHSIGTYHLTGLILDALMTKQKDIIEENKIELIKIGGLCHDLGHGPYSHTFDNYFLKDKDIGSWQYHEKRSQDIFKYIVDKYSLKFSENDVNFVCQVIDNNSNLWYLNLVSNKINGVDSDKLDYICRDNNAFGLKLNIDVNRIIKNCMIIDNKLCFCDRIKDDIFNLFFVRYRLYREIYCHPKIISFELSMKDILEESEDIINIMINKNIDKFCELTDYSILNFSSQQKRDEYAMRNKYKPNPDGEVTLNVEVGFLGNKTNPIENIFFYNRKNQNRCFKIESSSMNIFSRNKSFTENIEYNFRKN